MRSTKLRVGVEALDRLSFRPLPTEVRTTFKVVRVGDHAWAVNPKKPMTVYTTNERFWFPDRTRGMRRWKEDVIRSLRAPLTKLGLWDPKAAERARELAAIGRRAWKADWILRRSSKDMEALGVPLTKTQIAKLEQIKALEENL